MLKKPIMTNDQAGQCMCGVAIVTNKKVPEIKNKVVSNVVI